MALRDFPKNFRVGVRRIVARDDIFEPGDVQRLQCPRKGDGVLDRPAGSAVQGQPDFVAQHFLHGFHTRHDLCEAALGQQATVRVRRPRARFVVPAIRYGAHHRRIVKADRLLDEREPLFGLFHLGHVLGVILRRLAGHGEAHAAVVRAYAVPDLAAEQLINRHSSRLAGDVP